MGCVNIHASLLPRWRGAAPIQRAIEEGDRETGVTTMQMDAGLDTGPMLMSETMAIPTAMNAQQLHDELAKIGARLIVATLQGLASNHIIAEPQGDSGVTYAKKIDKGETHINWDQPAATVAQHIRAFYPMAWFEGLGQRIRVLDVDVVDGEGQPGTTLDDHLTVACATKALRLTRIQPAGKAAMDVKSFLNGHSVHVGETFQ
jgi:methionyl-tRNA formyltransferase